MRAIRLEQNSNRPARLGVGASPIEAAAAAAANNAAQNGRSVISNAPLSKSESRLLGKRRHTTLSDEQLAREESIRRQLEEIEQAESQNDSKTAVLNNTSSSTGAHPHKRAKQSFTAMLQSSEGAADVESEENEKKKLKMQRDRKKKKLKKKLKALQQTAAAGSSESSTAATVIDSSDDSDDDVEMINENVASASATPAAAAAIPTITRITITPASSISSSSSSSSSPASSSVSVPSWTIDKRPARTAKEKADALKAKLKANRKKGKEGLIEKQRLKEEEEKKKRRG